MDIKIFWCSKLSFCSQTQFSFSLNVCYKSHPVKSSSWAVCTSQDLCQELGTALQDPSISGLWWTHCMGFSLFLSIPVLLPTGVGEKEMKKKNTPCLSLLFPFSTSPVGCQLPAFLSLHPLPLQFCPCQRCAEIKDWGIAVRNLGKMCKKLNWDAKSLPSSCGR